MSSIIGFLFLLQSHFTSLYDTTIVKHFGKTEMHLQAPKFFIAGKQTKIIVVVKSNSDEDWTGYISLQVNDDKTKQNVDGLFSNIFSNQYFTISKKDSSVLEFPVEIPHQFYHPVQLSARLFEEEKVMDSLTVVIPYKK